MESNQICYCVEQIDTRWVTYPIAALGAVVISLIVIAHVRNLYRFCKAKRPAISD